MSKTKHKAEYRWLIPTISLIVGFAFISVIAFYCIKFNTEWFSFSNNKEDWGLFGDYIGGILNPIIAFMALIALLCTIKIQKQELADTRAVLREQEATNKKQNFESTFFALFKGHNQVLKVLSEDNTNRTGRDSDCKYVHKVCFSKVQTSLAKSKEKLLKDNKFIGHYFRLLYQLLKLVATKHPGSQITLECTLDELKNIKVTPEEKFYSSLVRSVLGYEITQLLAVYCYSENDTFSKFKQLVIRYQFFEHMPFEINGDQNSVLVETVTHYGEEAFGKSQFLPLLRT